ncbi:MULTISPECIES: N-6 DNA methylase [unclassified Streptomyces]|uniref:N-6 DNA methylase n=1 Tax=unclassified Streptomyces TaxID=2593676 RepID=UPI00136B63F9|nr:N-6 DNA methylase [Streptomyces sp. SID6139]MYR22255.1 N-6 DNA methylase [Streptomyces sp. SID6137]
MVNEPTVTAAEIARIAGVGPAAVSNWRRRYAEFPTPVGGTAGSPRFLLSEVVNWLEERGRSVRITPADEAWRAMEAVRDPGRPGAVLVSAGFRLLGEEPCRRQAGAEDGALPLPSALGAHIDGLRRELGAAEAFEQLLRRWTEAHARQIAVTPPPVAALMCALAGSTDGEAPVSVLDPACGTGGLLLQAAESGTTALLGQDLDRDLAEIAAVRLRLHGYDVSVKPGDSLLGDAHAISRVQGVVCDLPSGQRDWGRAELGYDTRWTHGLPPKGEPELAWLQHALAHLDDGGRAVLLIPAGVAARPSGRRIRAELLRRGTLRAVVALPSRASRAPGTHLWIVERSRAGAPPEDVLFVDADMFVGPDAERPGTRTDWEKVQTAVTSVWRRFRAGADLDADFASRVPITVLLRDDVDVTPALHVRTESGGAIDMTRWEEERSGWLRLLNELPSTLPVVRETPMPPTGPGEGGTSPRVSLDELIRSGALSTWRGSTPQHTIDGTTVRAPLLALDDGLSRSGPSGYTYVAESERLREGDVLVFAAAPESARPADPWEYGAAVGPGVTVLRSERTVLDPWFLAGTMTGGAGPGPFDASAVTAGRRSRLDTGRLFLPVRSPEEQQRIGQGFRDIARFEESLAAVVDQGRSIARQLAEALAAGLVDPIDDRRR